MASIHDVAKAAGVSTATVSRALRGLPSVTEKTRLKVLQTAARLDYTISPHASSLASGRSRTIGVVVPYVARWFFGHVIAGAEQVLRAAGFDLLLYAVNDNDARQRFFNDMPFKGRVDAIMVLTLPLTPDERSALRSAGVPLAIVGGDEAGFSSVRIDDSEGAATAVRHLVNLGHERIAVISGGVHDPLGFTTPASRLRGYREVMRSTGASPTDMLEEDGDFTLAGGERAMTRLLSAATPPTAVFAMSDEMAFGALRAMRRHGLRAPDDISIVGFDNHDMADLLDLTTVSQPVTEQGELAAQLLLELLGNESGSDLAHVVLPIELIVRSSTAALPGRNARTGGKQQTRGRKTRSG